MLMLLQIRLGKLPKGLFDLRGAMHKRSKFAAELRHFLGGGMDVLALPMGEPDLSMPASRRILVDGAFTVATFACHD
jgi:hypothetical protein